MTSAIESSCSSIRELGEAGLSHRIRPFLSHQSSVAPELFHIDELIGIRERALELLQRSFHAMDDDVLRAADRKLYKQEMSRRRRMLQELSCQRAGLLEEYGRELQASGVVHPELRAFQAS